MTDLEFLKKYWKEADRQEDVFLRKARRLHPEDEVQAALDRFGRLDDTTRLDVAELNRLHRDIEGWKEADLLTGEFGLRAKDASHRKRITTDEALLLCLMAAWAAYYAKIEYYAIDMFVAVTGASERRVRERLADSTPTTPQSFSNALDVDIAYRARQLQKLVQSDRQQTIVPKVTQKRYARVFEQQERCLIAQSEPTEDSPNGHHGYIDRVMAELLSYFAIDRYRQEGVQRVRFVAVIDEKTTHNCRRLHGREFAIDDLKPGINAPPIADPPHPCRSVLRPI